MVIALKALVVFKVSDKLNWVDPTVYPVPEALIGVSQGTLEVVTWFSCRTGNLNGARQLTGSTPLFVSLREILHYGFVYTLWIWKGPTRSLTISHHPWGYVGDSHCFKWISGATRVYAITNDACALPNGVTVVVIRAILVGNQSQRSKFRLDQSESRISPMWPWWRQMTRFCPRDP